MPKAAPRVVKAQPDAFIDEAPKEATFIEWFSAKLHDAFVNNIPLESIKELQSTYMYIFGVLAYALSVSCFIYFVYTGYSNALVKEYISLDSNDGNCRSVQKPITDVYYGSSTGIWSGSSGFKFASALYLLEFNNYNYDNSHYRNHMRTIKEELDELGQLATTQDLGMNLLYWMAWERFVGPTSSNIFEMMGNSLYVLNRQYLFCTVASVEGECNEPPASSIDQANGVARMTFSYSNFIENPNCSYVIPEFLGFDQQYDADNFDIVLDIRTAIVSIAVSALLNVVEVIYAGQYGYFEV